MLWCAVVCCADEMAVLCFAVLLYTVLLILLIIENILKLTCGTVLLIVCALCNYVVKMKAVIYCQ